MQKLLFQIFLLGTALVFLAGCSAPKPVALMATPVIYHDATIDPFSHLSPENKITATSLFYATNRKPQNTDNGELPYGNNVSKKLHFGSVTVRIGDNNISWLDLYLASIQENRPEPVPLFLETTDEVATIDPKEAVSGILSISPALKAFAEEIDAALEKATDKEIMLYVHGAKSSFLKSCSLTAELDHFTGRDFVSVAFSWPSHQNILSYVFGIDIRRAQHSTLSLRATINFLAKFTQVKHINIICYSAGARLTSRALQELRGAHPSLKAEELKKTFRLGTVVFAAADVPLDVFLNRLPSISELAQSVVVTVSDNDNVLRAASQFMGGDKRIGSEEAGVEEEKFVLSHDITNFEIVDLSHGKEKRGFDITGHHYWYRHPWASSDIIFLLRTDLPAHRRGLTPSGIKNIWYLPSEYPEQVRKAAKKELHGEW